MAKKRKPRPPKRRKKRGAGKSKPAPRSHSVSIFARAKPVAQSPKAFARVNRASIPPPPEKSSAESRRAQVRKLLERRNVYPEVIDAIVAMDPNKYYMIEIYAFVGSPREGAGQIIGDEPVLQASFVGTGAHLWVRVVAYASKAPIEHVEIYELDGAVQGRPLWARDSVKIVSGERFIGVGVADEWRDAKKAGRRKKPISGGKGMTADQRRKSRKSKRDAQKRRADARAKYQALAKQDPIAAEKYMARVKRSRKVDL